MAKLYRSISINLVLTQPVRVTSHNLGAARTGNLCGLLIADGMPPIRRVVFGELRIG